MNILPCSLIFVVSHGCERKVALLRIDEKKSEKSMFFEARAHNSKYNVKVPL